MMTNANAAPTDSPSLAPVVALATGILLSLTAMAAMVTSPATIPLWCAAHGGCP